jgi:hypothetical protein
MKNLTAIIITSLFFTVNVQAETCTSGDTVQTGEKLTDINTDVPAGMEGAVIIVRQKDGKESAVPIEKFKVVPRKQQLVTVVETKEKTTICTRTNDITKKNRASVLVGSGLVPGLKTDNQNAPGLVEVETRTGPVLGLQYQRKFDVLSIGVQGQTNETGSVLLGVDF